MKNVKILDCTLRDGGYYTKWDFDSNLTNDYFEAMNNLPIEYVEIGYRSPKLNGYLGEYFYCPEYVMKNAKDRMPNKKLVILLDVKSIEIEFIKEILKPCKDYISLIRIAVSPKMFLKALEVAKVVKELGYAIAFNVMYMSDWLKEEAFLEQIPLVNGLVDFFYMVDSYGGVTPEDVKRIITIVKSKTSTPIGFHGHNNLELGLINTVTAIECGCEIVDATITGMGRGAGNLKMELLLTYLSNKHKRDVSFNYLSTTVQGFTELNKKYNWGTNLAYMVSGANSLPQKQVMDWIAKRTYSIDSIITALYNDEEKSSNFGVFIPEKFNDKCLIIGGGESVINNKRAIIEFVSNNKEITIIHASSKNASVFSEVSNKQYFCLLGNEGYRMKRSLKSHIGKENLICVLPASPRKMGTFVPEKVKTKTFELESSAFSKSNVKSLELALQVGMETEAKKFYFAGFDGYSDTVSTSQMEISIENEKIFKEFMDKGYKAISLTYTKYENIEKQSIFSLID